MTKLNEHELELIAKHLAIDTLRLEDDVERVRIGERYLKGLSNYQKGMIAGYLINALVLHFDSMHRTSEGEQLATEIYLDTVKSSLPPLESIGMRL